MKIYYEQIKDEGLELETSFSFEEKDGVYNVTSFEGRLDKAGDAYIVSGVLELGVSCPCDRCLESVTLEYKENMNLTLSPLGVYPKPLTDDEAGLSDDEAGMYVTPHDHFDLNELLREEALLLPPIKKLCRDDCKGICSFCGTLLNNETCGCSDSTDLKTSVAEKIKKK